MKRKFFRQQETQNGLLGRIASQLDDPAVDIQNADPAAYTFTAADNIGIISSIHCCIVPDNTSVFSLTLDNETSLHAKLKTCSSTHSENR